MLTVVEATQALLTLTIQFFFFRIVDHGRCSEPWFSVPLVMLLSDQWDRRRSEATTAIRANR